MFYIILLFAGLLSTGNFLHTIQNTIASEIHGTYIARLKDTHPAIFPTNQPQSIPPVEVKIPTRLDTLAEHSGNHSQEMAKVIG